MAAEQLGISPRRFRAMITAGQVSATKLGHDWVVDELEVERLKALERKPGRPASRSKRKR